MANCAKCGAALPTGATTCEYCGSVTELPRSSTVRQGSPQASSAEQVGTAGEILRFKRCSVFVMILCAIFTLGLYMSIWYILRRDSLTKLDPAQSKRTDALVKGFIVVHVLYFCSAFVPELADVAGLLFLCFMGIFFYVSFTVRGLLRGYAQRMSPGNPVNAFIAPSAVWTALFGIFYLQTHINRMIDARLLEARL